MTSRLQSHVHAGHDWRYYASRPVFMMFAAIVVYVLSFGPIWNLTTAKIGPGGMRPAKLPKCADAVNTVYAPLIHVLVTPPHGMPCKALSWYIRLCDLGPSIELDYGDPKKVEAEMNEALAKIKNEIR
jgi:hypothetical protein